MSKPADFCGYECVAGSKLSCQFAHGRQCGGNRLPQGRRLNARILRLCGHGVSNQNGSSFRIAFDCSGFWFSQAATLSFVS